MFPHPRQWTRQPQGWAPPSQWAKARSLSLLVAADPRHERVRGAFVDLSLSVNATFQFQSTGYGLGFGGVSGGASTNSTGDLLWRGSWTAVCVAAPPSTSARYALSQSGTDTSALGFGFNDQFTGANGRFSLTLLDYGVNRSHAYVPSAANDTPRCFLMRKAGTTVTAWIDGAPQTVITSGGFTGSPGATSDTIRLYGSNANSFFCWATGTIGGLAFFNAAISDAECAAISTIGGFFGQLFAPRRIWVPQAAIAGLPTLSLPTYTPGSLTATGFRPRVTAT